MADHQEKDYKRDYINSLVQSYFPEISSLEDSTQTVIQTIFEWSLSNFEKRLKMYCSNAPRGDEDDLRRYMQTSDIQENYLMQIFKNRHINGHKQTSTSLLHNEPMQPTRLPTNPEPQQCGREPRVGTPNHVHVLQPAVNQTNQLITNIPNGQLAMPFPQMVIPIELPTASMLASVPPQDQKQLLGESLYPRIQRIHPDQAGKITGMLLELDNTELLHIVHSNDSLKAKVDEAVAVLQAHQAREAAAIRKE